VNEAKLLCPNRAEEGHNDSASYELVATHQAGRWRFACTDCRFTWFASDAAVRRLLTRRMVR